MGRRRRRNISVYIDSIGSGGRGWVTHLLHLGVEEGGGEEKISTIRLLYRYTEANMESILDRYTEAKIECSDMSTCIQHSLLSHLLSLLCLKQWQAIDVEEEEEEKHISLYRQHRLWGPWAVGG